MAATDGIGPKTYSGSKYYRPCPSGILANIRTRRLVAPVVQLTIEAVVMSVKYDDR